MSANLYLTSVEKQVLEDVRIGIAGAGGLGSNVAAHLVRAGVRKLVICDFDEVNASNLNRQFFFRDQIGKKKVAALGENLRRIEEGLDLTLLDLRLTAENAASTFADCDMVIEAFDNADAKAMLVAALLPLGKRLIAASGLAGWGRSAALKVRRLGTNLILVGDGETGVSEDCAPASPRVGIAAALQANTAIAWLLGKEL